MKPAARLTIVLLLLVAAAHLARLLLGLEVNVGGTPIPLWASGIAVVVPIGLAVGLWREGRQ